jgi:hypothetical protein
LFHGFDTLGSPLEGRRVPWLRRETCTLASHKRTLIQLLTVNRWGSRKRTLYLLLHLNSRHWDVLTKFYEIDTCDCFYVRFALLTMNEFRIARPNWEFSGCGSERVLIRDVIFRCSDLHGVTPMVLVRWVEVIDRHHRPRRWPKPSWQRIPTCCARSCGHNNWWLNNYGKCRRCNRSSYLQALFTQSTYLEWHKRHCRRNSTVGGAKFHAKPDGVRYPPRTLWGTITN